MNRLVWNLFHDSIGVRCITDFQKDRVWVKSDETSSRRSDPNRKIAERWFDALSRLLYWDWPVVGLSGFLFLCWLYVVIIHICLVYIYAFVALSSAYNASLSTGPEWTGTFGTRAEIFQWWLSRYTTYSKKVVMTKLSTLQKWRERKRDQGRLLAW